MMKAFITFFKDLKNKSELKHEKLRLHQTFDYKKDVLEKKRVKLIKLVGAFETKKIKKEDIVVCQKAFHHYESVFDEVMLLAKRMRALDVLSEGDFQRAMDAFNIEKIKASFNGAIHSKLKIQAFEVNELDKIFKQIEKTKKEANIKLIQFKELFKRIEDDDDFEVLKNEFNTFKEKLILAMEEYDLFLASLKVDLPKFKKIKPEKERYVHKVVEIDNIIKKRVQ